MPLLHRILGSVSTPIDPYIPSQPRKKNILPWILGGIALFLLLTVGGCVALIAASIKSADGGKVVAEQFLGDVVRHDFDKAYALMDPAAQKVTSQEMLKDLVGLVEKHKGKLNGHSEAKGTFVFAQNGRSGARFSYAFTTEKDNTSGDVTVVRAESGWKIYSFNLKP